MKQFTSCLEHWYGALFSAAILDKINGTFGPPLPPNSVTPKWCVFAPWIAPSSLLWGKGGRGLITPFYSVQDWILDKINWTFRPSLSPILMMVKWRVFTHSPLHHYCFGVGRRGFIIIPFYSVQDCSSWSRQDNIAWSKTVFTITAEKSRYTH